MSVACHVGKGDVVVDQRRRSRVRPLGYAFFALGMAVHILDARKVDLAANFFEGAVRAELMAAARACEDAGDIHRQGILADEAFRDVGVHSLAFV